jgi:hypothetical protein
MKKYQTDSKMIMCSISKRCIALALFIATFSFNLLFAEESIPKQRYEKDDPISARLKRDFRDDRAPVQEQNDSNEQLIEHIRNILPEDLKDTAPDVASLLVIMENDNLDISNIPQETLIQYARVIRKSYDQKTRGIQPDPALFAGFADQLVDQQLKDNEIKPASPSYKMRLLAGAYMLWRKFFSLYAAENSNTVGIRRRLADHAIRSVAAVVALNYQKNKYIPAIESMLVRSALGAGKSDDIQQVFIIFLKALEDTYCIWKKPDFFDDKVILPAQVLVKCAPVALYHFGKKNLFKNIPKYEVETLEKIAEGDIPVGFDSKDKDRLIKLIKQGAIAVKRGANSSDLRDYSAYKKAVIASAKLLVGGTTKLFENIITDNVDANKLEKVEKYTLGIIKPAMLSKLAKKILVPIAFDKTGEVLQDVKGISAIFPHFNDAELYAKKQTFRLKKTNADGKEETKKYEVYPTLSTGKFIGKKIGCYALEEAGKNIFIRALSGFFRYRQAMCSLAYKGLAKFANLFIKMKLTKKNFAQLIADKWNKFKHNFLIKRPELVTSIVSTALQLTRMEGNPTRGMFVTQDQKVLLEVMDDINYYYECEENIKRARFVGDRALGVFIERERKERLGKGVDKLLQRGIVDRFVDYIAVDGVLGSPNSFVRRIIENLGSDGMVKLGEKIGEKIGII